MKKVITLTLAGGALLINADPSITVRACQTATAPLDHECEKLPRDVARTVATLVGSASTASPVEEFWMYRDESTGIEQFIEPDSPFEITLEVADEQDEPPAPKRS